MNQIRKVGTFALCAALALPAAVLAADSGQTIKVTATGAALAEADVAFVDVMVKHTAENPRAARDGTAKATDRLLRALRKAGIPRGDVIQKPVDLIVYRPQDLRYMDGLAPKLPQQQETAVQLLRIKVRGIKLPGLAKVWKVVDASMAAGAEPLRDTRGYYSVTQHIPSFITLTLDKPGATSERAVDDALRRARTRAEQVARLGGLKLKGLHSAAVGQPLFQQVVRNVSMGVTQFNDYDAASLGKIRFSVTVEATYTVAP